MQQLAAPLLPTSPSHLSSLLPPLDGSGGGDGGLAVMGADVSHGSVGGRVRMEPSVGELPPCWAASTLPMTHARPRALQHAQRRSSTYTHVPGCRRHWLPPLECGTLACNAFRLVWLVPSRVLRLAQLHCCKPDQVLPSQCMPTA